MTSAAQEAHVPGYAYDVFVSYASVNNQVFPSSTSTVGWVEMMVNDLRISLSQALGRGDWGEVWWDKRIDETVPFPAEIASALRQSATLLVILSKGWLTSGWCPHELSTFIDNCKAQGQSADGRIFLVLLGDVDKKARPKALATLRGFEFFTESEPGLTQRVRNESRNEDDPTNGAYWNGLNRLSRRLSERLEGLRAAAGAAARALPQPESLSAADQANDAALRLDTAADAPAKTIFLSEPPASLRDKRDSLDSQLRQSGYRVIPDRHLPDALDAYREAAQTALSESLLLVQLLDGQQDDDNAGRSNHGARHDLDLALARASGTPCLRWMSPASAVVQGATAPEDAQPISGPFNSFIRQVEDLARERLRQRAAPPPSTQPRVFIRAQMIDREQAEAAGQCLSEHDVGHALDTSDQHLVELLTNAPGRRGLLLVQDRCDRDWISSQLHICRGIHLEHGAQAPAIALFSPTPDRARPRGLFRQLHRLDALSSAACADFLRAVRGNPLP